MNADMLAHILRLEGGYVLTNTAGDRGGMTYAGISRRFNPDWAGWPLVDKGDTSDPVLRELVALRYKERYWQPLCLDQVRAEDVARAIMSCGVVSGVRVASRLAQVVTSCEPDGVMGPVTLAAINDMSPLLFVARYAVARIARHSANVAANPDQMKFFRGWVNRAIAEV